MPFNFTEKIHQYGFKRLLLAVSGGLDSICMAHYFISNRDALGIEWLGIAHVHHGLREGTADRDAAFVDAFARKYNIPFFLKQLDGNALKAAEGSLEEIAREARYRALVEVAEGATIVTAHHAGDQAETLYMRLRRGTTLAGLRGIQETRALDPSTTPNGFDLDNISVYRPFLNTTRAELLLYAKENNLEWCEDESNTDVKFVRNKIRHDILPHLEKTCPGATKQLCKVAVLADKAYGKVMRVCEELFAPALCKGLRLPACNDVQLNKKILRKVLLEHTDADLSEMFRLWLSEQGFRFPIGFFFAPKEPAHVKIPHRAAYRKRAIVKLGSTIRICEFESVEAALKFVSCKK